MNAKELTISERELFDALTHITSEVAKFMCDCQLIGLEPTKRQLEDAAVAAAEGAG